MGIIEEYQYLKSTNRYYIYKMRYECFKHLMNKSYEENNWVNKMIIFLFFIRANFSCYFKKDISRHSTWSFY